MKKLSLPEVTDAMLALPLWKLDAAATAITREFVFNDFIQAFAFMTQVAMSAEKCNHHPEWSNVFNRVQVTWTTHDAAGLTQNDIVMATLCDQASVGYQR